MSTYHTKVNCKNCNKEVIKKNSEIRKSKTGNYFCSHSCSANYNNKLTPKRQVEGECKLCKTPITKMKTYCEKCYPIFLESRKKEPNKCLGCGIKIKRCNKRCINCFKKYQESLPKKPKTIKNRKWVTCSKCVDCGKDCSFVSKRCKICHKKYRNDPKTYDMTLKQAKYKKGFKSSSFALIRSRARNIAKNLGWNCCRVCGYSKHYEVCHIKPVSDFNEDTLISVVNDPSNLIPLCPNCHWELDHGLMNESEDIEFMI